jgi:hypothetical protein
MSWERQTLILLAPRQIRAQETRPFRLGRVAAGYVDDLSKKHCVSLQFSVKGSIKHQRDSIKEQKMHTSVRG